MASGEKGHKFMDMIKEGLSYFFKFISSSIFPQIAEGAEMVMDKIENRIIIMEKRIMKKISSLLIIGFGAVFLIFALLYLLIDVVGWSRAVAFFSIGINVFVIGLLLKVGESNR